MDTKGRLEVVCGPMYSGKSEEVIKRVIRAELSRKRAMLAKHVADDRFGEDLVTSRAGMTHVAKRVAEGYELMFLDDFDVVAIDEAQFFEDSSFVSGINYLISKGVRVIVSGLDLNYRTEPYGFMPDLMAGADQVTKLSAICFVCGADAIFTQKLINGKPAPFESPVFQIDVAGVHAYEARCRNCYESG